MLQCNRGPGRQHSLCEDRPAKPGAPASADRACAASPPSSVSSCPQRPRRATSVPCSRGGLAAPERSRLTPIGLSCMQSLSGFDSRTPQHKECRVKIWLHSFCFSCCFEDVTSHVKVVGFGPDSHSGFHQPVPGVDHPPPARECESPSPSADEGVARPTPKRVPTQKLECRMCRRLKNATNHERRTCLTTWDVC